MAEIKAELVKQLRERTGVGMMECKKALVATNGDLGEAEIYLRKQGLAKAGSKESRSAKQGLIGAYITVDRKLGVLVEVNCETDFVARTDEFQAMTADIAKHIAETKPKVLRLEDVAEAERTHIKDEIALYEQKFGADHSGTVGVSSAQRRQRGRYTLSGTGSGTRGGIGQPGVGAWRCRCFREAGPERPLAGNGSTGPGSGRRYGRGGEAGGPTRQGLPARHPGPEVSAAYHPGGCRPAAQRSEAGDRTTAGGERDRTRGVWPPIIPGLFAWRSLSYAP